MIYYTVIAWKPADKGRAVVRLTSVSFSSKADADSAQGEARVKAVAGELQAALRCGADEESTWVLVPGLMASTASHEKLWESTLSLPPADFLDIGTGLVASSDEAKVRLGWAVLALAVLRASESYGPAVMR